MPESSDKPFKIASILRVANGKCMFFFVRPRYFDFFLKNCKTEAIWNWKFNISRCFDIVEHVIFFPSAKMMWGYVLWNSDNLGLSFSLKF